MAERDDEQEFKVVDRRRFNLNDSAPRTPPVSAPPPQRRDFPPDIRERTKEITDRLRTEGDIDGLVHILTHVNGDVQWYAAEALIRIGPAAVDPLITFLSDTSNANGRKEAARALGEIGDARALDALAAALLDIGEDFNFNYTVREQAGGALGKLGDRRAVEPLLKALKDPHSRVQMFAARSLGQLGDPRAVEPLLEALRDPSYDVREESAWALGRLGDPRARPALEAACKDKDKDVAKAAELALQELSGDPTTRREESFLEAVRKGRLEEVRQLLGEGIDPNRGLTFADSALHPAIAFGQKAVVDLLLDHGATLEGRDSNDFTPLMKAAAVGQAAIVELLLDRGAEINARNDIGNTPLMFAAREGHDDVVKLLLARGANARLRTNDGRTAADIAERGGRSKMVSALRGAASGF